MKLETLYTKVYKESERIYMELKLDLKNKDIGVLMN